MSIYGTISARIERQYKKTHQLVHLIDVGDVPGIPMRDLRVGMRVMYNYGSTADVTEVWESKGFIHYAVIKNGTRYESRRKPSTLIAAFWPRDKKPLETPDYICPTCRKVLRHLRPDAPVEHQGADDHRLNGERLELITINGKALWA